MLNTIKEGLPKVSIVIVNYGGFDHLSTLFQALSAQSFQDFEIVVVDNRGKLRLPETVLRSRILKTPDNTNIGFAAGCNLGAMNSRGSCIVFLNNDTILDADWLVSLLGRLESDHSIGAVVSKILFFPRYIQLSIKSPIFRPLDLGLSDDERELGVRVQFEQSWNESTGILCQEGFHGAEVVAGKEWHWTGRDSIIWIPLEQEDVERFVLTIDTPVELNGNKVSIILGNQKREVVIDGEQKTINFQLTSSDSFDVINSAGSMLNEEGECLEAGIYEKDRSQFDESREVAVFSGCSVLIRREIFEALGGFDPAFFAYYEDTDLSWRMQKAGWKVIYEPKSVVRHHRSSSSGEQSPFFCFHIYRNMRWNVAKNARIGVAILLLAREIFSWIPKQVNTNKEYSATRLKCETIIGMMRYLLKRVF